MILIGQKFIEIAKMANLASFSEKCSMRLNSATRQVNC